MGEGPQYEVALLETQGGSNHGKIVPAYSTLALTQLKGSHQLSAVFFNNCGKTQDKICQLNHF